MYMQAMQACTRWRTCMHTGMHEKRSVSLTRGPCLDAHSALLISETLPPENAIIQLYLGRKTGLDEDAFFIHNHLVLDQTMVARNPKH